MTTAVFVLAHEPAGAGAPVAGPGGAAGPEAGPGGTARHEASTACSRLRQTLDALWSEEPGAPARIVVHAGPDLALVARREHGRRVEVWPADEAQGWAASLDALVAATRERSMVWLRLGARVTPGWLGELVAVIEADGVMAGPRLPLGAGAGPQGAHVPARPSRVDLREAATRVRFEAERVQQAEALAPACVALSRRTLDRVGRFDARYTSLHAVALDVQARLGARGGRLCVARRALVHAPAEPSLPEADAQALARRREGLAAASSAPLRPVALEVEADAPDRALRILLADALFARGVPVFTFAWRTRAPIQPGAAPHHMAASLEAATRGASLVLTREAARLPGPVRQLVPPGQPAGPRALAMPELGPPASWPQRLDAWVHEVEAAAAAVGEGER